MNRRKFMGYVGAGSMVSVLPVVTSACTSQVTKKAVTTTASAPRSDGFQVVGTVATLDKDTQLLVENVSSKKVLVFRDSADPQKVIAINPTCPHAGCAVAWQKQEGLLVCPCHDSKFTPDGQVKQGPADEPLPTYTAKIETDTILVKVA
jgi:cytochrome b6-f complex iron-sulfur subunit